MSKRSDIVLPETKIQSTERMATQCPRSSATKILRARLERAVVRDRDLDRRIYAEWRGV
jgi:hypothetical protein